MKEFQEEILAIDRVTRVTAGGRQLRFRVSLVIGDKKGRVGLGIGKAGEVQGAIEKALRDARKNLIKFPIKNGTIAHSVTVKYKSSMIFLHPAHPGTGIIAGGAARKVFAVSGVRDVIAKQHGSSNNISNARVTLKAVQALKPMDMIKDFSSSEDEKAAPKKEEKKSAPAKKTSTKKAAPKKSAPKKTEAKQVDDLTKVEGIGPKVTEIFKENGIQTFADLAKKTPEELKEILTPHGGRYAGMTTDTWPKQAVLAAEGKWDELKKWQDELNGGK